MPLPLEWERKTAGCYTSGKYEVFKGRAGWYPSGPGVSTICYRELIDAQRECYRAFLLSPWTEGELADIRNRARINTKA